MYILTVQPHLPLLMSPSTQQCALRWAALAGAKRIYAIDKIDSRLQLARSGARPGVVWTINYEQLDELDNVVEFIQAKNSDGLDWCGLHGVSG